MTLCAGYNTDIIAYDHSIIGVINIVVSYLMSVFQSESAVLNDMEHKKSDGGTERAVSAI